jgi:hypothetical protein
LAVAINITIRYTKNRTCGGNPGLSMDIHTVTP